MDRPYLSQDAWHAISDIWVILSVGQGRALPLVSDPVQELSRDLFSASETDHGGSHELVKDCKEHPAEPFQPRHLQYLEGSYAYPRGPKVWHLATARDLPTCVMLPPSLRYQLLNCAKGQLQTL